MRQKAAVATATKPDVKRLKDLHRQMNGLITAGRWEYADFLSVYNPAVEAAAGFGDALGFLFRAAKPEWRKKHWLTA